MVQTTGAVAAGSARQAPRAPHAALLWAVALAGAAAAVVLVSQTLASAELRQRALWAVLGDWLIVPYVAAGLVAWRRRPDSRLGLLMIAAGFAAFLSLLSWSNHAVLATVGEALSYLAPVVLLHLIMAFPSGRVEHRLERALVAGAYGVGLGLRLVVVLLGEEPSSLLAVVFVPAAAHVLQDVVLVGLGVACLAGVGVLAARRWRAGRSRRRVDAVLVGFFALVLLLIPVLFAAEALDLPAAEPIGMATFFSFGVAPVVFLAGLLHARLARSAVGELFVELRSPPAPAQLRAALARALRDPSLELAFWLPAFGVYGDVEGRPVELAERGGRAVTLIDRDGVRVAALVHDASLVDEPELLEAVTAAAAMALDNARLHAELRARVEELRESRVRILEAGQHERARLERNLHDGAQQRLIALALELGRLEERLGADPDARRRVEQARGEVAASLAELRAIAGGLHPAVVTGHGLAVALESLVARAPVPVRLTVAVDGRLPEAVEVAAYYVIAEALANVGKHAAASGATVSVTRPHAVVVVEVVDDGVGGADSELGSGLRGLADRVETLDGWLRVWSPRGGGTRLRAELPCAS